MTTDGESNSGTESGLDRSSVPLLQRAAAAEFDALWISADGIPDAFSFVSTRERLTQGEYVDIFLVDQRRRADRGRSIAAEIYRGFLHRRFDQLNVELEWELVAHEFLLTQALDERSAGNHVQEFSARFPEFQDRLAALFRNDDLVGTQMLDQTEDVQDVLNATVPLAVTQPHISPDIKLDPSATMLDFDDPDQSSLAYIPDSYIHEQSSILGSTQPFSQLPPVIVGEIEQRLEELEFRPGERLIKQGDPADGLYLLTKGDVEIRSTDDEGESRVIADAGCGEILGEMALLTDEPRTADVVAKTASNVRFLPAPVFHDLATEFPVIGRILTQLLAERLGQSGHDALSGKTFGRYRIVRRLGRGGMAIVYRAEDIQTGEPVALKMMSHRLVYDANALNLFQREAQMIESFDHPGIVRMLGRFKAFRSFFIVLEFCDGVTLDRVVRRYGPLAEKQFRRVVAQLAGALAYAHSNNVVHRDVKPSNVMLTAANEVKLMDFGLARPVETEASSRGLIAGTPRYMAPEQLQGDMTSPRADLFSLGCTAWKLLTGDDLIRDTRITDILRRHENWKIPELRGVSREVVEFIGTCLQVDPEKRDIDLAAVSEWS